MESLNYFKDYKTKYTVDPITGKVQKSRAYAGERYRLNADDKEWHRIRLYIPGIYLILAASCIEAMLVNISANTVRWFSIPAILTMLLFCYGLRGIIYLETSGREMTKYSSEQIQECIMTSAVFLRFTSGAGVAAGIIGMILYVFSGREAAVPWGMYLLLQVVCLLMSLLAYRVSRGWYFVCINPGEACEE